MPFPEDDPIADIPEAPSTECVEDAVAAPADEIPEGTIYWPVSGNRVADNVVTGSGEWDLVLITLSEDALDNCFEGNEAAITSPPEIHETLPCEGSQESYAPEIGRFLELVEAERPPIGDYQTADLPDPGDLGGMPDPENAPAEPAGPPAAVDLDAIELPDAP